MPTTAKKRDYYQKNKERLKAKRMERYYANQEKERKYMERYRKDNDDLKALKRIKAQQRAKTLADWNPYIKAWEMLVRITDGRKRAPMETALTFWHIPWTNECNSCGAELDWKNRTTKHGAHFDRIDSERAYEIGNVQILCRTCNLSKLDRGTREWEHYMEDNYERFS